MVLKKKSLGIVVTLIILFSFSSIVAFADFPYETTNHTDLSTAGAGAILFGMGYWVESAAGNSPHSQSFTPDELLAMSPETVNVFDRSATDNWSPTAAKFSDVLMYSSAVAPLTLLATEEGSRQPLVLTAMHLETLLLNGGVTYLMKNMFQRSRPFVVNTDTQIPISLRQSATARRSFPSGHTSTSFASMVFLATTFSTLYPNSDARPYVWGGCLAMAGTTGYLRYRAGWHYPTDILAGAALGAFAGWLVPRLHEIDTLDTGFSKSKTPPMIFGFSVAF